MIVSLDYYFTRKRAVYIISIVLLDVFIFSKTTGEVFATLYVNYIKIRLQNTLIMRLPFFKTIPCNKPKIYFMKNYACTSIPSLFFCFQLQ
jgi:hypothetical protein